MATNIGSKPSLGRRWEDYQPSKGILFWACAATAVATIVIGFNWGGWVTGGTSRDMATNAGDLARNKLASSICVERFNAAPDAVAHLATFKGIAGGYKQQEFIEAGGWATMPGDTSPNRRAAEGCAATLAG